MSDTTPPTLLRTHDGAMYYIPGAQLAQYRVAQDKAAEVEQKLQALNGEDPEVAGFSFNEAVTPTSLGFDDPMDPTSSSMQIVYCPGHRDY